MRAVKKCLYVLAIVSAVLVILCAAPGVNAASLEVTSGHPRILIVPQDLPKLQTRAATSHSDTYSALKTWCDHNWNDPVKRRMLIGGDFKHDAGVLRYALIYLLGEISGFDYSQHSIADYGNMAATILGDMVRDGVSSWKYYVPMSIAYDWVNDRLSSDLKKKLVSYFVAKCGTEPRLADDSNGYRFPRTPDSLYPGLAFYGDGIDDAQAQKYIEFIPSFLDDVRPICHESGEDGGHAAGLAYTQYAYGSGYALALDFYALVTATNLTIDDTFNKYKFLNGFPTWLLYGLQPGPPSPSYYPSHDVAGLTKIEDSGSWLWNIRNNNYVLMQELRVLANVAKYNGDLPKAEVITWLVDKKFACPSHESTFDIIFSDKEIPAKSPGELGLPTTKAFGWNEEERTIDSYLDNPKAGLGQVYMKSSWDQNAQTTHALFKAFPYYYFGHQHFDSLSFSIFKGQPLALQNSGGYFMHYEGGGVDESPAPGFPHHWYYYERTISHNSLLVMDPNEVIHMREPFYDSDPEFRDGGQRAFNDPTGPWGSVTANGPRDWGGLIHFEDTPDYTYSSGDATKGYNSTVDGVEYLTRDASPKVSLVQRDFVYLKSDNLGSDDYFVVFDRVNSTDPTFKKVFLLHTVGEPMLDGNASRIYGAGKSGVFKSTDSSSFAINQSKSKLFVKTLLPEARTVYKMGGTASTTSLQPIDNTTGNTLQGPKIDISVASTAGFSDKPVVTIKGVRDDGKLSKECFACEGKTANKLVGCIRGTRYWKGNPPLTHESGTTVEQEYAWMVREVDTGNWISYPNDFGNAHTLNDFLKDADEYGKWALWIENSTVDNNTNFLNVLHPTVDMAEDAMAETELLESGNMAGAMIHGKAASWVVFFSRTKEPQTGLTYQAQHTGKGKHLITGLESGAYDIYAGDTKIKTVQTSNQNTIYFDADGGSVIQISKSGTVPDFPLSVSISAVHQSGSAPLQVTFTGSVTNSAGAIVSYKWDFGDGTTSSEQNPSHTYQVAGDYKATLKVTEGTGRTAQADVIISVTNATSPPKASISANPTSGTAPLTVQFQGAGSSNDGIIVSYFWKFGDGATSSEQNPLHLYSSSGLYGVSLTVKDSNGNTGEATAQVRVEQDTGTPDVPPAVSFSADPTAGVAPLDVQFSSSAVDADGNISSYQWDFGDGSTSTEQNPKHTFANPGDYAITLKVQDAAGSSASASLNIHVGALGSTGNSYPTATIGLEPAGGKAPLKVSFTGTGKDSDGNVVSYLWNFGDGTTSNEQNPAHVFQSDGSYVVSLTVTDDKGARGNATQTVRVGSSEPFPYVVNDFTFHPIPEVPRPEKGAVIEDPVFHTSITRVTDTPQDIPGATPVKNYCHPGYPKHNIENADGTKLIIQANKWPGWYIFDAATFKYLKTIPSQYVDTKDPDVRWDNSDPDIFYTTYSTRFYKCNAGDDPVSCTMLHDFKSDFPNDPVVRVYTKEEGDASDDRRYWAFLVTCYDPNHDPTWYDLALIVYDKDKDGPDKGGIISTLKEGDKDADGNQLWYYGGGGFCGMSPSGDFVWVGDEHRIYPRDLSRVKFLGCSGHADMAYDDEGREVIVCGKYRDSYKQVWVMMVDLATGEQTWLAPLDNGGYHISANSHDRPGWALVSTYSPTYPDVAQTWSDHSLIMVELTRRTDPAPRVWRVAHTHTLRKDYADDPFAKLNKRGTKIWFGSGWDHSRVDDQYDVYQVNLPPSWYEDLNGSSPPPTCTIVAEPSSGTAPLSVKFTGSGKVTQGSIVSYAWNFGDGTVSNQQNPVHTYDHPGKYRVVLQVTDNSGGIGQATADIAADSGSTGTGSSPPTATISARPVSGTSPLSVDFHAVGSVTDGTIVSYKWDFGDGSTSADKEASHTYVQPGTYAVTLTVVSNTGETGQVRLNIEVTSGAQTGDGIPSATISADRQEGTAPVRVKFSGKGSDGNGSIVSYFWNLGNGYVSTSQNPITTYSAPGNYIVALSVIDNDGFVGSASIPIRVTGGDNQVPDVSIDASPLSGPAPLKVTFEGSGHDTDGTIAGFFWSFGDGRTSAAPRTIYTYDKPGNYVAVLCARDNEGARTCSSVSISVSDESISSLLKPPSELHLVTP